MGKRSPGPMSYIREASALRNIKLCYAGRSFSIRVVIRCLRYFAKKWCNKYKSSLAKIS